MVCKVVREGRAGCVWHKQGRGVWCPSPSAAGGCSESCSGQGHGATCSFMPVLLLHWLIKRRKPTYKGMEFIKSGRVVNNLMFAFSNRGNDRRA